MIYLIRDLGYVISSQPEQISNQAALHDAGLLLSSVGDN